MKDVAARAGVSTATVSFVLNNQPARISAETAATVRRVAEEMGYRPDLNARSLRTQRSGLIGMVSDEVVTTPYAGEMILGAQEAAWERDYMILIGNTGTDSSRETELLSIFRDRRIDGYLLASMYHRLRPAPGVLQGLPAVGLDQEIGEAGPSYVPNEVAGATDAVRLLLEAGHRRIAHLQGRVHAPASGLRADTYRRLMQDAGVYDPDLMRTHGDDPTEGDSDFAERATGELLSLADPPTAIFAFNDRMAIGVYRTAAQRGLVIPRDLSVVGFDDQPLIAAELRPALTTVALPHYQMGYQAAQRLIDLLDGGDVGDAGVNLVACPLVVRDSVAAPSH